MRFAKNADVCVCVWTAGEGRPPKVHGRSRLLHVDEEVALEDVLPFLVLLGLFIRLVLQSKTHGAREPERGMDGWSGWAGGKGMLTYFQPSMVLHLQQ